MYALDFFLHTRLLALRNGIDAPAGYDSTLGKMLTVVQALSQSGPPEGFGDDDGGRVFDPRRNRTEHMTDPLALGRLLFGRKDLSASSLTEESIWLFGREAVNGLPIDRRQQDGTFPIPVSSAFPDGGLYILAASRPVAQQIVVDAGPQGIGHSGHGHADALSLRLTINGRRCLVDSGSGVYIAADQEDRNAFRQTAAHNTMRVDGIDQAQPDGPFSWTAIPETRLENWTTGKTFSYFAGSHNGFARLSDPVTHYRCVIAVCDGPVLVRDVALGQKEHDLELFWHFACDLEVREVSACALTISNPASSEGGRPLLDLIMPEETAWQWDITRTLISPAYGKFDPAPLVRVHTCQRLPAEITTLLRTRSSPAQQAGHLVSMRHAAAQVYEWVEESANHGFCFALDKRPWSFGPWFSDAEFLYCRIEAERLTHLFVVGGTYVAWKNQELLKARGPSDFFEWRKHDDLVHSEPEEFSLSPLFYELTGRANLQPEKSNVSSTYAEKP